jgi:uncharacterized iron-regulated membrane protein
VKFHNRTRLIFTIHSYTGLITGIALLLISLSGAILVFSRDLDRTIYRDILEVQPAGSRISLDSGYRLMKVEFPEMNYITYDGLPKDERSAYQFFMMKNGEHFKAFLNPYTSEILHHGKQHDYWMDWLLLFHYTFAIPVWGELAAAILSLALLTSILTGAIVYRKYLTKVLLFKVTFRRKNWRTLSSSLHRIVGVWSLLFHILFAVTAFWLLRHTFTKEHYKESIAAGIEAPVLNFSIDSLLTEIKSKYPRFQPQFLTLPETKGIPAYLYGHSNGVSFFYANYYDEIQFDGTTIEGNFLEERTASEKFDLMMYPVHAGLYGGIIVKIIYSIGGMTPGILGLTGFLLWWRRKR